MDIESLDCLLCQTSAPNLYEINNNSILISDELQSIDDILFEIFSRRSDSSVTSFICEECKDQIVQFYIFKKNVCNNLNTSAAETAVENLRSFLDKTRDKGVIVFSYSEKEFTVKISEKSDDDVKLDMCDDSIFVEVDEEASNHSTTEQIDIFEAEEPDFHVEIRSEDRKLVDVLDLSKPDGSFTTLMRSMKTTEEQDAVMNIIEDGQQERLYACECRDLFSSLKELEQHTATKHTKRIEKQKTVSSNFQGACCGVAFKDEKYLKLHKKAHESFEAIIPNMIFHQCGECLVFYSNEDDLFTHESLHENQELEQNMLIERLSAYEDHFLNDGTKIKMEDDEHYSDTTEKLLTCGHCGKKSPEFEMKLHLLFFHSCTLICPLDNRCFDGYKQVRLFPDHVKNKHPEIFSDKVTFKCSYCGDEFSSPFERLAHMKRCDMKKFTCEKHCGKRFGSEWLLKKHLKIVRNEEQRFVCSMCGKKCVSKSDLQIHLRSHTNERPYECSICHKFFKTSANRSSHMDIHRQDKVHECDVCFEKFQTRPILRKHKKKHDSEYQSTCICQICNKNYINRPHLLRHIKAAHTQEDLTTNDIEEFFQKYFLNKED